MLSIRINFKEHALSALAHAQRLVKRGEPKRSLCNAQAALGYVMSAVRGAAEESWLKEIDTELKAEDYPRAFLRAIAHAEDVLKEYEYLTEAELQKELDRQQERE